MTAPAAILPLTIAVLIAAATFLAWDRVQSTLSRISTWSCSHPIAAAAIALLVSSAVLICPPRQYASYGGYLPDRPSYELGALRLLAGNGNTVTVNGSVLPSSYPVGAPWVFSQLFRIIHSRDRLLLTPACGALGACAALLLFLGLRRRVGPGAAFFGLALLLTSNSAGYLQWDSSELVSLVGAALVYVLQPSMETSLLAVAAGGALAGLAVLVRLTNLALLAAVLSAAVSRDRARLAASALAIALCAVPVFLLFKHNLVTFGSPLRTGYNFWDSYWFDRHALSLRYALLGGGPTAKVGLGNALKLLLTLSGVAALAGQSLGSPFDFVLFGSALAGSWRTARQTVVSAAAIGVPLFAFYSCYAFNNPRYLLPAWPWALELCAEGGRRLTRLSSHRRAAVGAAFCAGTVAFGAARATSANAWPLPVLTAGPATTEVAVLHWLRDRTEPDALIVSGLHPMELELEVLAGTQRTQVQLVSAQVSIWVRPTSYPMHVICRHEPEGLDPPGDPTAYDKWALLHGCTKVPLGTAIENLAWLKNKVDQSSHVYLDDSWASSYPDNARSIAELRTNFRFDPLATFAVPHEKSPITIYRLSPRNSQRTAPEPVHFH